MSNDPLLYPKAFLRFLRMLQLLLVYISEIIIIIIRINKRYPAATVLVSFLLSTYMIVVRVICYVPVGDLFLPIFLLRCGGSGEWQSGGAVAVGGAGVGVTGAGSTGGGSAECRRSAASHRCASVAPSACVRETNWSDVAIWGSLAF